MPLPAHPLLGRPAPEHPRRGTAARLLRHAPVVAVAVTMAVVGSLAAAPASARAESISIADSVHAGTFEQDLLSGAISVDQVVDADIATLSTGGARPPSREELARQTREEIQDLRRTGPETDADTDTDTDADAEMGPETDATGSASTAERSADALDPVAASQRSIFSKIKHAFRHWWTVRINAALGLGLGGAAMGVGGTAAAICLGIGSVPCAALFAGGAAIAATLASLSSVCVSEHHDYLYIKIPGFGNSHCGD